MRSALSRPTTDPTPIFDAVRASYATELLTVAIAEFNLFGRLVETAKSPDQLRSELQLKERPFLVLTTALRAMGLLTLDEARRFALTASAREHLTPGGPFDISGYVNLTADAPGVRQMAERLRTDRPAGAAVPEQGAAFIFREGVESAMEQESSARRLTLALAGRARVCAPYLAEAAQLDDAEVLLDMGGGTGIYSIACLQMYPHLRAVVFDRPEVLKIAAEFAADYGVAERLHCQPGDMFTTPLPGPADAILLSNVLHDWDTPQCQQLVSQSAAALSPGGRLLIHDVFLDDDLGGPLVTALYSAALFSLTEGRAYSAGEYRDWLTAAGLESGAVIPTHVNCGLLVGTKARAT